MKTMMMAAALVGALYIPCASAGEESTDRYGQGGTGMPWYATNCGLAKFPGPRGNSEDRRPCGRPGVAYDENGNLMPRQPAAEKKDAPSTAEKPQK